MTDLATALRAESAVVRWLALANLNSAPPANLAEAATLSMLTGVLLDEHAFVRWQAGLALAGVDNGRQKLTELLQNYPSPLSEISSNSKNLGVEFLYSVVIDALADQDNIDLNPYLTSPLRSGEAILRQSAAEALARQKPTVEAIPELIAALKDDNPWVRRAAVLALGQLGEAGVARSLVPCLRDRAVLVRRCAAYALGALRAETALPALRVSLLDRDPQVKRNAAWALGRIGRVEAVADLSQLLDDPDLNGAVAAAAEEAIKSIKKPLWRRLWPGSRPS